MAKLRGLLAGNSKHNRPRKWTEGIKARRVRFVSARAPRWVVQRAAALRSAGERPRRRVPGEPGAGRPAQRYLHARVKNGDKNDLRGRRGGRLASPRVGQEAAR